MVIGLVNADKHFKYGRELVWLYKIDAIRFAEVACSFGGAQRWDDVLGEPSITEALGATMCGHEDLLKIESWRASRYDASSTVFSRNQGRGNASLHGVP